MDVYAISIKIFNYYATQSSFKFKKNKKVSQFFHDVQRIKELDYFHSVRVRICD